MPFTFDNVSFNVTFAPFLISFRFCLFLKGPLFVYFLPSIVTILIIETEKSIDSMLGVQTRGCRMVGAEETTKLCLLCFKITFLFSLYLHLGIALMFFLHCISFISLSLYSFHLPNNLSSCLRQIILCTFIFSYFASKHFTIFLLCAWADESTEPIIYRLM